MTNERALDWRVRAETAVINYGSAACAHQSHPSERSWGRFEAHKGVLFRILDEPLSWSAQDTAAAEAACRHVRSSPPRSAEP